MLLSLFGTNREESKPKKSTPKPLTTPTADRLTEDEEKRRRLWLFRMPCRLYQVPIAVGSLGTFDFRSCACTVLVQVRYSTPCPRIAIVTTFSLTKSKATMASTTLYRGFAQAGRRVASRSFLAHRSSPALARSWFSSYPPHEVVGLPALSPVRS